MDDDWYDDDTVDGNEAMIAASVHSLSDKLHNDGYRVGRSMEDDAQMQRGFDEGFSRGIVVGKACGRLYAATKTFTINFLSPEERSSAEQSLHELERLLLAVVRGSQHSHLRDVLDVVEQSVLRTSCSLSAEFESFKTALLDGFLPRWDNLSTVQ